MLFLFMNELGDRIKSTIKDLKITQKQMAKDLGMRELTLGRIIRGEVEPGYIKVKQIADYLHVDLNWLITGKTLAERRAYQHSTYTEITGSGHHVSGITVFNPSGKMQQVSERRSTYQAHGMSAIIKKALLLSPESRDIIEKMIDIYIEKEGKKA